MPLAAHKREYVEHRVLTASPVELVQILYQSGVQAVDEAVVALHAGDILARGNAVTKAIEILSELQASLRHDGPDEYAATLYGLYSYMQRQLMRAHRESSAGMLAEVSRLLSTLLQGWTEAFDKSSIAEDAQSGVPAMQHEEAPTDVNPYSWQLAGSSQDNRCWQF